MVKVLSYLSRKSVGVPLNPYPVRDGQYAMIGCIILDELLDKYVFIFSYGWYFVSTKEFPFHGKNSLAANNLNVCSNNTFEFD